MKQHGLNCRKRPLSVSDHLGVTFWVVAEGRFEFIAGKIPGGKGTGTNHSVGIKLFELPVLINQGRPVFLPLLSQVHKSLCTRIHNTLQ